MGSYVNYAPAMAIWPGNRIVLNRNRAHKLQKRGEWIRWNAEKKYWEWTPCATWDRHFVCPICEGTHWGTSQVKDWHGDIQQHGRCHKPGCGFEWDRRDDNDVFVWVRRQKYSDSGKFNIKRGA